MQSSVLLSQLTWYREKTHDVPHAHQCPGSSLAAWARGRPEDANYPLWHRGHRPCDQPAKLEGLRSDVHALTVHVDLTLDVRCPVSEGPAVFVICHNAPLWACVCICTSPIHEGKDTV